MKNDNWEDSTDPWKAYKLVAAPIAIAGPVLSIASMALLWEVPDYVKVLSFGLAIFATLFTVIIGGAELVADARRRHKEKGKKEEIEARLKRLETLLATDSTK